MTTSTFDNLTDHFVSIPYLSGCGWREDHNNGTVTIFSRSLHDTTGRYEILARENEVGQIVAFASWGTGGKEYRYGQALFGDRLEAVIGDRLGY